MRTKRYLMYLLSILHIPFTLIKIIALATNVADDYCTEYFKKRIEELEADIEEDDSCTTCDGWGYIEGKEGRRKNKCEQCI